MDAPKPGNKRAKPLIQYLKNLEKCRKLSANFTFSGHGPIISDLNGAIDGHISNIEHRVSRVINTLKKQMVLQPELKLYKTCTGKV